MTEGLIKRLREDSFDWDMEVAVSRCREAADRIEQLESLLEQRDLFIVNKGFWSEFVASIPMTEKKDD